MVKNNEYLKCTTLLYYPSFILLPTSHSLPPSFPSIYPPPFLRLPSSLFSSFSSPLHPSFPTCIFVFLLLFLLPLFLSSFLILFHMSFLFCLLFPYPCLLSLFFPYFVHPPSHLIYSLCCHHSPLSFFPIFFFPPHPRYTVRVKYNEVQ